MNTASHPKPLRILHLTGTLDRGGIESWLVNLLAQVPGSEARMDVLVVSPDPRPGDLDRQVWGLGGRAFHAPPTGRPLAFLAALWRHLREHGPYDVVHSHIHHFGGLALLAARLAGVPVRAATSHLDSRRGDAAAGRGRRLYLRGMRAALESGVTHRLAVSAEAAAALFGPGWRERGTRLVTLGVNLEAVRGARGGAEHLRRELGLPPGEAVIGHVGQFRPQKNHLFLLDVFAAYLRRHGPARLLLVGDGPERSRVGARVRELGLEDRVHLTGSRPDVPGLLWAMDAFVFPSLTEGLSLALLEAQAAGLPAVVSRGVPLDPRMRLEAVEVLDLEAGGEAWADAVARALARGRAVPEALDFDVARTSRELLAFYAQAVQEAGAGGGPR
ncbi:glycosyltransferase involved in cell wall biosynthesis [Deinococcus sp. HSC-46F16]|uniref:glycosyltransferase n=1 Tax=Deinococcus sp. HSC-46F16 TaxID=2910968 RepID=UPI0020A0BF7D|nr:glycosyltransferase [Deinococcus sp. HSC-46F16]MCP2014424.1 glycosyltransferase involved in cell wall biosynthesis [Deinococcus sp. HSC-46F16]